MATRRERSGHPNVLLCDSGDNSIRWTPGERLHHLFEERCEILLRQGDASHAALAIGQTTVSFAELDSRANQIARVLAHKGLAAGDRVGLILDRSISSYAALLAVLKLGAAYVPLDVRYPSDRVSFIARDAEIAAMISVAAGQNAVRSLEIPIFDLEAIALSAQHEATDRIPASALPAADDELCYIIYTSGSTGNPKGVAVDHSSICNFVTVAGEVYQYSPADRVFQGMTLAFDFSVEELWVPLIAGATLVPSPADVQLVGRDLAQFLNENQITSLCCVPTLLATLDEEIPRLDFLLVSGEACPQDLVTRWHRPGRRMLNAYGPTEATVTATWVDLAPGAAVTIGGPLPTYAVVILDPDRDALVEGEGATGEIGIAGIGLAVGYVNRDDLTAKAFIEDFLQLPDNPSHRIYRSGDLGRINAARQIEYLGRIDTQVKIRGYRVELSEIENVLLRVRGISQAVVTVFVPPAAGMQSPPPELAAYYTRFKDQPAPGIDDIMQTLRGRLPGYMIPAYIQELDRIPMLPSDKADRKALPPPSGPRVVSSTRAFVAPNSGTEKTIAETLAEMLGLEQVSVEDNFFEDLGAHSLLMARFLASLQQRLPGVALAISDVYSAPTVAEFAKVVETATASGKPLRRVEPAHIASDFDYYLCGTLQFLYYVAILVLYGGLGGAGSLWILEAEGLPEFATRGMVFAAAALTFLSLFPVAMKWLLVGRWRAEKFPIWGLRYFRFWLVRELISSNPLVLFRGTPLFNAYLRMLGAKVGQDSIILSRSMPVATDLISIGSRSVLRKQCVITGHRAENGWIELGGIELGANCIVGEGSVIDINTAMGDGAQLGHASSLQAGQSVPAGARYHGSPAIETITGYLYAPQTGIPNLRKVIYSGVQ
ncbi:MAG TPA: amino acid adenylation domain-containing protein, partial [Hyphomicrobiaceae bacterium]|nr:amino acid adenylation domain-containing protein [Hyphomicrobiaceae bacterium]